MALQWIKEQIFKDLHTDLDKKCKVIVPQRLTNLVYVKNVVILSPTNTLVTTFNITDTTTNYSIIYAVLYSNIVQEVIIPEEISEYKNQLEHQFVCIGSSFMSRDGEYRKRILGYNTLIALIATYPEIMEQLERYALDKINDMPWLLSVSYLYPDTDVEDKYAIELQKFVEAQRLHIKFLMLCNLIDMFEIARNIKINHINTQYKRIMGYDSEDILKVEHVFIKKLIDDKFEDIVVIYSSLNGYSQINSIKKRGRPTLELGQKYIPLSLRDFQNPFNIMHKPWKEFLVTNRVQNLLYSGITLGVPMLCDYFLINTNKKAIFDNYIQQLKLEHSDEALRLVQQLILAQRGTFTNQPKQISKFGVPIKQTRRDILENVTKLENGKKSTDDTETDDTAEVVNQYMSQRFKKLHDLINDPIEYAKGQIIMSDYVLAMIMEHCGFTFYDSLTALHDNKWYKIQASDPYNNLPIWDKYIFEVIYALFAVNKHYGIIHGDLHMNNFNIQDQWGTGIMPAVVRENGQAHAIYIIDGKHYIFPTGAFASVLIDFSRAIIRPSCLELFENFELKEAKKIKLDKNGDITMLTQGQKDEMLRLQVIQIGDFYKSYFNNFHAKHAIGLYQFLYKNFDQLFPLLTAIDTYKFTSALLAYFAKHPVQDITRLIEPINEMARTILVDEMETYISNADKPVPECTWANQRILKLFDSYISNPEDIKGFVSTICNIDNKIAYDVDYYDTFPIYAQKVVASEKFNTTLEKHRRLFENNKIMQLKKISELAAASKRRSLA